MERDSPSRPIRSEWCGSSRNGRGRSAAGRADPLSLKRRVRHFKDRLLRQLEVHAVHGVPREFCAPIPAVAIEEGGEQKRPSMGKMKALRNNLCSKEQINGGSPAMIRETTRIATPMTDAEDTRRLDLIEDDRKLLVDLCEDLLERFDGEIKARDFKGADINAKFQTLLELPDRVGAIFRESTRLAEFLEHRCLSGRAETNVCSVLRWNRHSIA